MLFDNSKQSLDDVKQLMRLMNEVYAEGGTDVEVARALGCTKAEFEHAYRTIPAFRRLVDIGRTAAEAYLIKKARENFNNKGFNSQVFGLYMKNLQGWSEKSEVIGATKDPSLMTEEELNQRIESYNQALLAKAKKADDTPLIGVDKTDE